MDTSTRVEVQSACQACRKSRVKCEKLLPCSRCQRLNIPCEAQLRGRGRPPSGQSSSNKKKNKGPGRKPKELSIDPLSTLSTLSPSPFYLDSSMSGAGSGESIKKEDLNKAIQNQIAALTPRTMTNPEEINRLLASSPNAISRLQLLLASAASTPTNGNNGGGVVLDNFSASNSLQNQNRTNLKRSTSHDEDSSSTFNGLGVNGLAQQAVSSLNSSGGLNPSSSVASNASSPSSSSANFATSLSSLLAGQMIGFAPNSDSNLTPHGYVQSDKRFFFPNGSSPTSAGGNNASSTNSNGMSLAAAAAAAAARYSAGVQQQQQHHPQVSQVAIPPQQNMIRNNSSGSPRSLTSRSSSDPEGINQMFASNGHEGKTLHKTQSTSSLASFLSNSSDNAGRETWLLQQQQQRAQQLPAASSNNSNNNRGGRGKSAKGTKSASRKGSNQQSQPPKRTSCNPCSAILDTFRKLASQGDLDECASISFAKLWSTMARRQQDAQILGMVETLSTGLRADLRTSNQPSTTPSGEGPLSFGSPVDPRKLLDNMSQQYSLRSKWDTPDAAFLEATIVHGDVSVWCNSLWSEMLADPKYLEKGSFAHSLASLFPDEDGNAWFRALATQGFSLTDGGSVSRETLQMYYKNTAFTLPALVDTHLFVREDGAAARITMRVLLLPQPQQKDSLFAFGSVSSIGSVLMQYSLRPSCGRIVGTQSSSSTDIDMDSDVRDQDEEDVEQGREPEHVVDEEERHPKRAKLSPSNENDRNMINQQTSEQKQKSESDSEPEREGENGTNSSNQPEDDGNETSSSAIVNPKVQLQIVSDTSPSKESNCDTPTMTSLVSRMLENPEFVQLGENTPTATSSNNNFDGSMCLMAEPVGCEDDNYEHSATSPADLNLEEDLKTERDEKLPSQNDSCKKAFKTNAEHMHTSNVKREREIG